MSMGRSGRILVVEDDERMARVVKTFLEGSGYTVCVAGRGEAAVAHVASEPVDLVILDVRLPDLDGYEVCRRMRQLFQPWTLPVLMLTGMDEPVDQLRGYAHGADAYLTKPCEFRDLLNTITQLMGSATSH